MCPGSRATFGSNPGIEAITFTAPVSGSIATTEPAPFDPGVEAIACWSSWTASRCACASSVRVMSAPSCSWFCELVDDRGELVLLAREQVVLGELDPGPPDVDEAVADRVAEHRRASAG